MFNFTEQTYISEDVEQGDVSPLLVGIRNGTATL